MGKHRWGVVQEEYGVNSRSESASIENITRVFIIVSTDADILKNRRSTYLNTEVYH